MRAMGLPEPPIRIVFSDEPAKPGELEAAMLTWTESLLLQQQQSCSLKALSESAEMFDHYHRATVAGASFRFSAEADHRRAMASHGARSAMFTLAAQVASWVYKQIQIWRM
jgi:hypothetical protein